VVDKIMKFTQSDQDREVKRWFADGGDLRFRFDYDLNEESVVFDLGGYQGWLAERINERFKSKIYVFEPYIPFYEDMNAKFKEESNIKLFNYGLSNVNGNLEFVKSNDGSHLLECENGKPTNDNSELVEIKSFSETYKSLCIDTIDLLKINVEGAEYAIMKDIFENNLQSKIRNFQIQFHYLSEKSIDDLSLIRKELSKTHIQKWNYEFVWESWELK